MIIGRDRFEKRSMLFRYFTVLSNLLCGAASLLMAAFGLFGRVPAAVLLLKYISTCAVTVTFLTVMVFLGPASGNFLETIKGPDFFLHLLCPLLAIVSFVFFEKTSMPFGVVFLGTAPVLLYGLLYLYKVVFAPAEKRWDDFYTFNRGGKWPISFTAMVLGGFIVSLVLWAV